MKRPCMFLNFIRPRATFALLGMWLAFSNAYAQPDIWKAWLASQIQKHPDVVTSKEAWLRQEAEAEAMEQPLFNPELSTELERDGDNNNFNLGIQQTIDWWEVKQSRTKQASYLRSAAEAQYKDKVLNRTADALSALIRWQAAALAMELVSQQQEQQRTLFELVENRQKAGDLGQIDTELAFLSFSKQLTKVGEIESNLQRSISRTQELLPDWTAPAGGIPTEFWKTPLDINVDEELWKIPKLADLKARSDALAIAAEVRRREAKAEPTFGINAGRDDDENVLGFSFSIPLNVRNTYSAEARAAERASQEARTKLKAIHRKQQFEWQEANAVWLRYKELYDHWQSKIKNRVHDSQDLLERQWLSGDLSTSEYLQALNERSETLLAGIELEMHTRLEFIEVLLKSGALLATVHPGNRK